MASRQSITASVFTRSGPPGAPRDPAEVVFESSSVSHAAAVERRTLREMEDKACELRVLVGSSYRELIASADTILDMRRTAGAVVTSLKRMRGELEALSRLREGSEESGGAGGAEEAGAPVAARREARASARAARDGAFAAGCRVKFVADSPELLWGALEDGEFAAAADRLGAARDVHAGLLSSADDGGAALGARFPLLRGVWPSVEGFRGAVARAARAAAADTRAPARAVADALAGAALAEDAHALEALGTFLDARRTLLRSQLDAAASRADAAPPGGAAAAAAAAAGLADAVATAQAALCQAGELFLDTPGAQKGVCVSLLFATLTHANNVHAHTHTHARRAAAAVRRAGAAAAAGGARCRHAGRGGGGCCVGVTPRRRGGALASAPARRRRRRGARVAGRRRGRRGARSAAAAGARASTARAPKRQRIIRFRIIFSIRCCLCCRSLCAPWPRGARILPPRRHRRRARRRRRRLLGGRRISRRRCRPRCRRRNRCNLRACGCMVSILPPGAGRAPVFVGCLFWRCIRGAHECAGQRCACSAAAGCGGGGCACCAACAACCGAARRRARVRAAAGRRRAVGAA
jgi:hypothetical protein